jgi:putative transposase
VHDQLVSSRAFRVLTVINNRGRERVFLEVGFRLTRQSVADALDRVGKRRKLLATITVDLATEFTSLALDK